MNRPTAELLIKTLLNWLRHLAPYVAADQQDEWDKARAIIEQVVLKDLSGDTLYG